MPELQYIGPGGRAPRPLLRTKIGEALRRRRLDQRRTLADVARAARVSMPYLSEVERGRKEASSEVLAAVCDALRIELAEVLTEIGQDLARDRAQLTRTAPRRAEATRVAGSVSGRDLAQPDPSQRALAQRALAQRALAQRGRAGRGQDATVHIGSWAGARAAGRTGMGEVLLRAA